jgi:hypothetical protein
MLGLLSFSSFGSLRGVGTFCFVVAVDLMGRGVVKKLFSE